MQAILDKIIRIRAIGDLIGLIVGGVAFLAFFIGWAIYQVRKDKKGMEYDIISWPDK